jgi:hypothetical protein
MGGRVIENHDQASARVIVAEVRRLGGRLILTDDDLGVTIPLPDALADLIRSHKQAIIDYLKHSRRIVTQQF